MYYYFIAFLYEHAFEHQNKVNVSVRPPNIDTYAYINSKWKLLEIHYSGVFIKIRNVKSPLNSLPQKQTNIYLDTR